MVNITILLWTVTTLRYDDAKSKTEKLALPQHETHSPRGRKKGVFFDKKKRRRRPSGASTKTFDRGNSTCACAIENGETIAEEKNEHLRVKHEKLTQHSSSELLFGCHIGLCSFTRLNVTLNLPMQRNQMNFVIRVLARWSLLPVSLSLTAVRTGFRLYVV